MMNNKVLVCDYDDCDAYLTGGPSNGYRPAKTKKEARVLGKELGWTYVGGNDLCPEHSGA